MKATRRTFEATEPVGPEWSRRFGLRLLLLYFALYAFPFPLGSLPWTEKLQELYEALIRPAVLWVGASVLGIAGPIPTEPSGSGDRTYDYVLVLSQLVLALAAALAWSLADRRGRRDGALLEGLRLYVRVLVGYFMLSYGFIKIFEGQFARPSAIQLAQTYGESSPMNLLWTFMGSSRPYTIFAGLMEAIPGTLLLFRRTASIGALVLLGVVGNIVLLNLCYDVPVKLFSAHLWFMCLFLAAPALRRLFEVLALNRATAAAPASRLPFVSLRGRAIAAAVYVGLALSLAFHAIYPAWKQQVAREESARDPDVRGAFLVQSMIVNGQEVPLDANDPRRWARVGIFSRGVWIFWVDGRSELFRAQGEIGGPMTLDLRRWEEPENVQRALLDLRREDGRFALAGRFEGHVVRARLVKLDLSRSLLKTRGFHWINEVPFNR